MTIQRTKMLIGTIWILAAGGMAIAGDAFTFSRVMLLVGFGFVPPAVILTLWQPPTPTLSESIEEARR